jgi:quercetin dioxygenase-like cupin family protein
MRIPIALGWLAVTAAGAAAQTPAAPPATQATGSMALYPGGPVEWKDAPASMPRGVKMAVLEGDPTQPGMFTMRLRFPDGTRVSPHYHTATEHMTVISGVLHLGMGEKFDRDATQKLAAGSFGFWAAGTKHFAWFEGETVLQLHAQGPWTVTYVNPADDPRKPH